jgi:acyl-coenzyme A synthetase/AMP-(fatty) acid ligase
LQARIDLVYLPRPLYFVGSLPRNATGKLPREVLLRFAAECARRKASGGRTGDTA